MNFIFLNWVVLGILLILGNAAFAIIRPGSALQYIAFGSIWALVAIQLVKEIGYPIFQ